MWVYRKDRGVWELVGANGVEIALSEETLRALCAYTGLDTRRALEWVAQRPRVPYAGDAAA